QVVVARRLRRFLLHKDSRRNPLSAIQALLARLNETSEVSKKVFHFVGSLQLQYLSTNATIGTLLQESFEAGSAQLPELLLVDANCTETVRQLWSRKNFLRPDAGSHGSFTIRTQRGRAAAYKLVGIVSEVSYPSHRFELHVIASAKICTSTSVKGPVETKEFRWVEQWVYLDGTDERACTPGVAANFEMPWRTPHLLAFRRVGNCKQRDDYPPVQSKRRLRTNRGNY
ncbi:MAG: hypothetical protein MHM6MM_007987, partial [Cercozoa sp. M6MM]